MRKILKEDKLYSLVEFRDRLYDDLDLSRSDVATLLCAMLIASILFNIKMTMNFKKLIRRRKKLQLKTRNRNNFPRQIHKKERTELIVLSF